MYVVFTNNALKLDINSVRNGVVAISGTYTSNGKTATFASRTVAEGDTLEYNLPDTLNEVSDRVEAAVMGAMVLEDS